MEKINITSNKDLKDYMDSQARVQNGRVAQ